MKKIRQTFFLANFFAIRSHPGFSVTEVIVALLLMLIGGSILLSFMVYSTGMSVNSQQQSYGLKWIQEDLEQVKVAAANWNFGTLINNAGTLQINGCASSNCGLVTGDRIRLKDATTISTVASISSSTITLTPPPSPLIGPGTSIAFVSVNACMATTMSNGLATAFAADLPTLAPAPTTNYVWKGTTYSLARGGYNSAATPSVKNVAPFNILEIADRVAPVSGPGKTFVVSTEILPSAALQCP